MPGPMKLGLSSYTYGWAVGVPGSFPDKPMDAFALITRAQEFDISLLQIADNLPLHRLPEKEQDRLADTMTTAYIELELGMAGIRPEQFDRYLPLCRKYNARLLRTLIDSPDHKPDVAEAVSLIKEQAPRLEEYGVTLALENHDRFRADEFLHIIETVNSDHVGICLDTVNSFGALEGPEVVIGALLPITVNVHIKDFTVERAPHKMGFSIHGAPAGKGRLNIPDLLDRIRKCGRQPNLILEQWPVPEKEIQATVQKEARWAAEGVAYLKSVL